MQEDQTLYRSNEPNMTSSQSDLSNVKTNMKSYFSNTFASIGSFFGNLRNSPNSQSSFDPLIAAGVISVGALCYYYPIVLARIIHCIGIVNPIVRTVFAIVDNNLQEQRMFLKWWCTYIITGLLIVLTTPIVQLAFPANALANIYFIALFMPPYQLASEIFDRAISPICKRYRRTIARGQENIAGSVSQMFTGLSSKFENGLDSFWENMFGTRFPLSHLFDDNVDEHTNQYGSKYPTLTSRQSEDQPAHHHSHVANDEILEHKYDHEDEDDANRASDEGMFNKSTVSESSSPATNVHKKTKVALDTQHLPKQKAANHQILQKHSEDEKLDVA